jgi:TonB family protein
VPPHGGNPLLLDKLESGIVALETEYGPIYVQPSGWERLYLLWTFRHFNSLPLVTLNSRQRRLVERLPRCSAHNAWGTLDRMQVIGTVEGATTPSFSKPLPKETTAIARTSEDPSVPEALPAAVPANLYENSDAQGKISRTPAAPVVARRRGHSRIALILATGVLCAIFAITAWHRLRPAETSNAADVQIPNHVPESALAETNIQGNANESPTQASMHDGVQPDINPVNQTVDVVTSLPSASAVAVPEQTVEMPAAIASAKASDTAKIPEASLKPRLNPAQNPGQNKEKSLLAGIPTAGMREETQRIQFAGPPRKLIYPDYPETSARGKVILKAVIGADGRVREVNIVSGNKVLSAAAARAIRQWRYDPFYKNGEAMERETNVGVLFVAADVISLSFPSGSSIAQ